MINSGDRSRGAYLHETGIENFESGNDVRNARRRRHERAMATVLALDTFDFSINAYGEQLS